MSKMITTRHPLVERIVLQKQRMVEQNQIRADEIIENWRILMDISSPPLGMHKITNLFFNSNLQKIVVDFDDNPIK